MTDSPEPTGAGARAPGLAAAPSAALRTALADRYRLERELGQGGLATIYLAHELEHGRNVALKIR